MKQFRLLRQPLAGFLIFLILSTTLSCYSRRTMAASRLTKISPENLEFIVINSAAPERDMWVLSATVFQDSALEARFDRASAEFVKKIRSIRTNGDRGANQNKVLVYVNAPVAQAFSDTFTARLDYRDITRIEVFEPDAGKVVATIFAVLGGIALFAIIVVLISCSCPYVYAETPEGPQLAGELFSGAALPQLERHDWLPLPPPLQPQDGHYVLRLTNEAFENQHTNLLELEALDAAPGIRPLFDRYGRLHTISAAQAPLRATDGAGQDIGALLLREDEQIFRGAPENQHPGAVEQVRLEFRKPAGATSVKLLIRAKNNPWLDYTYHQMQEELGVYGPRIRQKYQKKSAAENLAWLERQKIPLALWLETRPGHWEKLDHFQPAGSMALRHDVLAIDVSKVQGDTVRLRLEFGFNFWEIDYAALDFSAPAPVQRHRLPAASALTGSGADVAAALAADDERYYDQPEVGDVARLRFAAPPLAKGLERSLVLHAKGHYEIRYPPSGLRPGYFQLKNWEKENALPRYSRERWLESSRRWRVN